MQRLSLLFLAFLIAGCDRDKAEPIDARNDRINESRNTAYRDVQLRTDMTITEIKAEFGEPDSYKNLGIIAGHHVEILKYGPFGADTKDGHVTKYRLTLSFDDAKLAMWDKSAPTKEKQ